MMCCVNAVSWYCSHFFSKEKRRQTQSKGVKNGEKTKQSKRNIPHRNSRAVARDVSLNSRRYAASFSTSRSTRSKKGVPRKTTRAPRARAPGDTATPRTAGVAWGEACVLYAGAGCGKGSRRGWVETPRPYDGEASCAFCLPQTLAHLRGDLNFSQRPATR